MTHRVGDRVLIAASVPWSGVIENVGEYQGQTRLTVTRDDGIKEYVLPAVTNVSTVETVPPPPSQHYAPPVGVRHDGVSVPPAPHLAPALAPAPEPVTVKARFMVQSKGRPQIFHTREDCARVKDGKKLVVDDEAIEFWDLSQCQSCAKLDSQITPLEALVASLPGVSVEAIAAAVDDLTKLGFSFSPEAVDRPEGAE